MRDRELAAKLLARAEALPGPRSKVDQLVSDESGIGIRSIRRWRTMLPKDPELYRLYSEALKPLSSAAADQFEVAKLKLLKLVVESAEAVNPKSPRSLLARTKALAAVSEAQRSEKVLNVWVESSVIDKPTDQLTQRVEFDYEVEAEQAEDHEGEVSEVEPAPEASVVNS